MHYLSEEKTSQKTSDLGQCIIDWISQDPLIQIIQNFRLKIQYSSTSAVPSFLILHL